MHTSYQLTLFADYFQFYLLNEGTAVDFSQAWSQIAVDRLLAFNPNSRECFAVGTVRNMDVPVSIEVHDTAPEQEEFEKWNKVNECSIEIPSGKLVVMGCTDYLPDAKRIQLAAKTYRARIYYGKLNTISEDGFNGDDYYKIVLWQAPFSLHVVLKS